MFEAAFLAAQFCGGIPFTPTYNDRPISSLPDYPPGLVDSVRRPGFNGRLFVTRPIIGGLEGPYADAYPEPGYNYYGAFLNPCDAVPVRINHLTIAVSPWVAWGEPGHGRIENARQFWLEEKNYIGGVRTHVNDLYLFAELMEAPLVAAPVPAAIIEMNPDAPRHRSRIRVELDGPARISWPHNAPASAVAITDASGGYIQPREEGRPIYTAAK